MTVIAAYMSHAYAMGTALTGSFPCERPTLKSEDCITYGK